MALKDYGVALGGIAAVAALSMLRSKASMSRSESDDEGDEDDPGLLEYRLGRYRSVAKVNAEEIAEESDDLEVLTNEATLDIANESIKAAIRDENPLIMKKGFTPTFSGDMYEGLPRAYPDEWTANPEARFRILYSAALQARSAYDKISRLPPKVVLAPPSVWGKSEEEPGEVLEVVPSHRLLGALASAMGYAANEALKDSAATIDEFGAEIGSIPAALHNMMRRARVLAPMHDQMEREHWAKKAMR